MSIKDLKVGEVLEVASLFGGKSQKQSEYPIGKNMIVRTVTMIYTGRLEDVTETDLILVDCSWIPETDRYMDFVAEGKVKECEPYSDGLKVYINRGALLDMCELRKELPRSQR